MEYGTSFSFSGDRNIWLFDSPAAFSVIFFSFSSPLLPSLFDEPMHYLLRSKVRTRKEVLFFGYFRAYPGPVTWALALKISALISFLFSSFISFAYDFHNVCALLFFNSTFHEKTAQQKQHKKVFVSRSYSSLYTSVFFMFKGTTSEKKRDQLEKDRWFEKETKVYKNKQVGMFVIYWSTDKISFQFLFCTLDSVFIEKRVCFLALL